MHSYDVALLRGAAIPAAAVGALLLVVSGLLAGTPGLIGAALGVGIVAAFFTVGLVVIAWASRISPQIMMMVAIVSYMIKIALLAIFVVAFAGSTAFNNRAFAAAVALSTLVWVGGEVRAFSRLRIPYVDPTVNRS